MNKLSDEILKKITEPEFNESLDYSLVSTDEGFHHLLSLDWENFGLNLRNDFMLLLEEYCGDSCGELWNSCADSYRLEEMNLVKEFFRSYGYSQDKVDAISFDLGGILIYKYLQKEVNISYPVYDEMYSIYKHGLIPVKYDPDNSSTKFSVMKL